VVEYGTAAEERLPAGRIGVDEAASVDEQVHDSVVLSDEPPRLAVVE
jgi:hypothetical protein